MYGKHPVSFLKFEFLILALVAEADLSRQIDMYGYADEVRGESSNVLDDLDYEDPELALRAQLKWVDGIEIQVGELSTRAQILDALKKSEGKPNGYRVGHREHGTPEEWVRTIYALQTRLMGAVNAEEVRNQWFLSSRNIG